MTTHARQPLRLPLPSDLAAMTPEGTLVAGVDPGPSGGAVVALLHLGGDVLVAWWWEWWSLPVTQSRPRPQMMCYRHPSGDGETGGVSRRQEPPKVAHDLLAAEAAPALEACDSVAVERPYITGRRTALVDTIESAGVWRAASRGAARTVRPLASEVRAWLGVSRGAPSAREADRRVRRVMLDLIAEGIPSEHGEPDAPMLTPRRQARHVWDASACAMYAMARHVAEQ